MLYGVGVFRRHAALVHDRGQELFTFALRH